MSAFGGNFSRKINGSKLTDKWEVNGDFPQAGCGIIISLKEINEKRSEERMACALPNLQMEREALPRAHGFQTRSGESS